MNIHGFFGLLSAFFINNNIILVNKKSVIVKKNRYIQKKALDIVKILKQWSQSAGNSLVLVDNTLDKAGTSETLRNEIVTQLETVKPVSIHVPIHLKPSNDEQFGHYLAGLIDGDGHISSKQQIVITFNILDIKLAYFIKKRLGYGSVQKINNKNAVNLVIASAKGIENVITLINGKFRTNSKFTQISENILSNVKFKDFSKISRLEKNSSDNLDNHWLAGFSDADASFQIKLIDRNDRTEVRLNFQIDQKQNYLLVLIKNYLGGNLGYRESQDTYYYGSTSFGVARKVIKYFDNYHLLSSKHINYLKWRKAYIHVQNKEHLNKAGSQKITKLKASMNRLYVESTI